MEQCHRATIAAVRRAASVALALCLGLGVLSAQAADAYVRITAPHDGAALNRKQRLEVTYEARRGAKGHHVHLYVDGEEVAILRRLKGKHSLDALLPGERVICIKAVNRAHVPIGVEQCIRVKVE
jgi:hypothetical protein